MERHKKLRQIARTLYALPGLRSVTRNLVRSVAQWFPLSRKNRWRLFNFFAQDTAPLRTILCDVRVPGGSSVRLELDLRDYLDRVWYYLGYGGYENDTVLFLDKLSRTKSCVFDVGANIGYYTVLAACLTKGQVHAFEPWSRMFSRLSQNIALNGFSQVYLNQMAMSDHDGQKQLFLPPPSSSGLAPSMAGLTASLVEGHLDTLPTLHETVQTTRLDTYCDQNGVRFIDLLRIDVEGSELRVLQGMGRLLDAWWPDLVFEVLPSYERDLDDFFLDKPYQKFLITHSGLQKVDRIRAYPRSRDYYLSCTPVSWDGA